MATFDGVRSRFWGYVGGQLEAYGLTGMETGARLTPPTAVGRWSEYATRWAYYENDRLYYALHAAKVREIPMPTEWNPVPSVGAFYLANTLGGELSIATADDVATAEGLASAIEDVWGWSNFHVFKQDLVETAEVLGRVFVKVAERQDDGDTDEGGVTTAVYLQNIPPESVQMWEADERGFLTAIRIDTPRRTSIFTGEERRHMLVEFWRKEWGDGTGGVRFYETLPGRPVDDAQLDDPVRVQTFEELGYDFIPLVWAEASTYWWQQTDQIDRFNALGLKIDRLNRPTGVIHGRHTDSDGRPMPAPRVDVNEVETTYQEAAEGTFGWLRVPGNSQFEWAASPIDLATARAQMLDIRQGVEASLPEYRVATLDASQVATETLQMLLSQAGQRVLELRETLERALVRAQQMAVSVAQVAGLEGFDPAAVGSWEAGTTEHAFAERGVFETPAAIKAVILKELVAAGMPFKMAMGEAGYSAAQIEEYDATAAEDALRQRTTLAAQLVRQRAAFDSGAADNGATQL